MVRKLTSATPIISDDAVRAVRLGLRMALSRAIAPGVPRSLAIGAPSTAATGRASTGPSTDTARNRPKAPIPTVAALVAFSPTSITAAGGHRGRGPDDHAAARTPPSGPGRLSRRAAIGATFDARRAGSTAEARVMTTPTVTEPMAR